MPPPPPKKDVKKPIIIVPTTSSVQSTIGVTTVNTTVVVLPSRAETTTINAITSTQAEFGVCQTLTSNSEASATNVSLTGNQPANSLHLASSTADILNQHAMPVVTNEAMAQIHHENVGQIRDEQTWQPDALVSSDGTVEHSLFDDQQATAEPSGMLDDSVQSLSESIENNIIESFSQAGGVHQGSLQSISDGGASYQQHNQFMDGQPIGYQGNMTTISQRHLPPHPGTPLDSPAPHTPHPTTPAHALTPSHSMTPQPHTPCTPHTPNAHTPSHPLTPTHRQQQQSRYFLFPPRQQLQDTLSNPVYPQADHLQSPHPNTQALQSPHPQTQALQSPHPQAQALQSPHPQAQALQSPHPQAQALQSQHPQHGQVLQSPHPQQTQALQSPLPQTVQAGHPQVMQSPMHPPSHQPLQSPLPQQQNMLQNALPQTGPMNLPMAHQMQTSGMQSSLSQQVLHSPMPQTQVPLPQHHTPLQSPLVQPQNLQQQQQPAQQQAHIFNFGHQTHVTLQQQQQAALQQQSQDDQHFEMELQQQIDRLSKQHEMERQRQNEEAIQQVERKLLEDLENLEKEALHKQQQQAKFDLESDLPIIQLQPPPPPRFQRQQQQQQQQQMQQQQQQAQQMMEEVPQQVLQKTEDIAYPDRVPSVVSDSLDQIIDGSGDLSDLLSLNLDAVPSDRKRPAGGQLDPCQPPKRPCLVLRQPGKPTALPFKKQDSSDSDRQDGATEHDDDDDDTDGQTDDSQPSAASRPMSGPGPCHRPRSGKQMRLIEAANKQCATGSGGGGQSSSSKSSSDGQTGGSGAGASTSTSTPASSSHSTSSASGSASSGGASNGAGGSGGGGGNPNDGVFRNPSGPAPPMKGKKKHRPEPLIIPPHVNHFGFPSRLRSPRLRESSNRMTPPPYTPPPMLSPVRSGAGLFWTLQTPKSAPITPRLIRRASLVAAAPPPEVIEEVDEEEAEPPPETDIQPHVNIGDQYQAKVPKCTGNPGSNVKSPSPEIMMWDPSVMEDLTEEELQYYQDFACCAAIPGNGTNKEYALHLLYICKGNVKKAILRLMQGTALVPENHTLKSYKYQESDLWTPEEIEAYHQALIKCDKDFFSIAKELGTKTVKQCVQFYYLWKKVCTDEYRKLRQVRRKREQDELYNLRSRASGTQGAAEPSSENQESHSPKLDENFSTKQALNGHIRVHGSQAQDSSPCAPSHRSTSPSPGPPSNKSSHSEDVEEGSFPCKLCDRVFTKVKSRNAHMKSHRQTETEHRPSYLPSDEC